jgi:undecaprenyl phosphate-alpha-L-ara4N flippase subunit ArnF
VSTHRRELGAALLLGSIVLSACGQLAMKVGMGELHGLLAGTATAWSSPQLLAAPAVWWTAAGLASYGASMLCWLVVLARYPLSFAYPMLGLSYVLVYWGATHWPRLAEASSPTRSLGTLVIVIGIALVSLSAERQASAREGPTRP